MADKAYVYSPAEFEPMDNVIAKIHDGTYHRAHIYKWRARYPSQVNSDKVDYSVILKCAGTSGCYHDVEDINVFSPDEDLPLCVKCSPWSYIEHQIKKQYAG